VLVEQEMEKVIARFLACLNLEVEAGVMLLAEVHRKVEILLKIYPPKAATHLLVP
jgi:hypothetical protein